ncbi:MAG: putative signal transducing protein [Janthinobacterium lividum]
MSKTLANNDEVDATQPVLYNDEELVTVAEFPDPATAHMARMALESANIPVFLQGENANNLLPIAFGARVMVPPAHEAAARAVLAAFEAQPVSFEDVTEAESEDDNLRAFEIADAEVREL